MHENKMTFEPWLRGMPTKEQLAKKAEQFAKNTIKKIQGKPRPITPEELRNCAGRLGQPAFQPAIHQPEADLREEIETSYKPKGMTNEQKDRLRGYLDNMKKHKGDCVVCLCRPNQQQPVAPHPAQEFFTTPEIVAGHIELSLYGVCAGHTMLSNSDSLMDKAVKKLKELAKTEKPEKINLLIVTYNVDSEELKYV